MWPNPISSTTEHFWTIYVRDAHTHMIVFNVHLCKHTRTHTHTCPSTFMCARSLHNVRGRGASESCRVCYVLCSTIPELGQQTHCIYVYNVHILVCTYGKLFDQRAHMNLCEGHHQLVKLHIISGGMWTVFLKGGSASRIYSCCNSYIVCSEKKYGENNKLWLMK